MAQFESHEYSSYSLKVQQRSKGATCATVVPTSVVQWSTSGSSAADLTVQPNL